MAGRGPAGRVRAARASDLDAICGIEARAFEPARRSSRTALRRALGSTFQRVLVFDAGEGPLGYLIVWPYRHTWRLYNLASDPERRAAGIGSALLAAASVRARRAGARRLVLESRDDPALLGFYTRRGFRATRRLPDYYSKGEDALRMERPLRPS